MVWPLSPEIRLTESSEKVFEVALASPSDVFNYADQGLISLFIDSVKVAVADLGANFDEERRGGQQLISQYNNQGSGDPISAGEVLFDGGVLKILSVGIYNNFRRWQKGNVKAVFGDITLAGVEEGYHRIALVRDLAVSQTSRNLEFWYDPTDSTPSFVEEPAVFESDVVGKYLSGVKYYTIGDRFEVAFVADGVFDKFYHPTQVARYSMPGLSARTRNPYTPPIDGSSFEVHDIDIELNQSNVASKDARLSVTIQNAYKQTATASSPSENRLVLTYHKRSTNTTEYFCDEHYRLPLDFDFEFKNAIAAEEWDSEAPLENGNAQCGVVGTSTALIYPHEDYSVCKPENDVDYSSFSGDQQYVRAIVTSSPKASVNLLLEGVSKIDPVGTGNLNLEIKLPTQTGWLDCAKDYSSAAGVENDGDGCLSGSIDYSGGSAKLTATFGGKNTVDSGGIAYVRITLRSPSQSVRRLQAVDW